jgi:hypothetical protein
MFAFSKLIKDVFDPKDGEHVIVLNDFPINESEINEDFLQRKKFAQMWHDAFKNFPQVTIEPIIYYEPTGGHCVPLPEIAMQDGKQINFTEKLLSLGEKDIVIVLSRYSATAPLDKLTRGQKFRVASLPLADLQMTAFDADYKKMRKKAKILAEKLTKARGAIVTFSTGHEIYFDLRGRNADVDDGDCRTPGRVINLPSGEAYIPPDESNKSKTKGYLPVYHEGSLVVYEVKRNRIIDVISDSPIARKLQRYFRADPARANIAELGLGCNDKAVFMNNRVQDEKIEGMHWAYGYNDYLGGNVGVSDFKDPLSAIHVEVIYTKEAKIKVREIQLSYEDKTREVIMENSRYSFNILKLFEN